MHTLGRETWLVPCFSRTQICSQVVFLEGLSFPEARFRSVTARLHHLDCPSSLRFGGRAGQADSLSPHWGLPAILALERNAWPGLPGSRC